MSSPKPQLIIPEITTTLHTPEKGAEAAQATPDVIRTLKKLAITLDDLAERQVVAPVDIQPAGYAGDGQPLTGTPANRPSVKRNQGYTVTKVQGRLSS